MEPTSGEIGQRDRPRLFFLVFADSVTAVRWSMRVMRALMVSELGRQVSHCDQSVKGSDRPWGKRWHDCGEEDKGRDRPSPLFGITC
jgi:hypothetical protein